MGGSGQPTPVIGVDRDPDETIVPGIDGGSRTLKGNPYGSVESVSPLAVQLVAEPWALEDLNPRQLGPKPSTLSKLS